MGVIFQNNKTKLPFMCVMEAGPRRYFLNGSGVNQLRELGWETGTFEQQFRDRFQQIGRRVSNIHPVVNSWIQFAKNYAAENPMTALTALALAITCAIPVVVFLTFALITLLVTFTGFLFVEGTILGFAAMLLGGILLVVGGITLSFVSFVLVSYFVITKIYTKLTGDPAPHRFLTKVPYIGHLFANMDHLGSNGDAPKVPNGSNEDEPPSDESLAHTD
ncbi:uncharacterized protein LOC110863469 isoform X2 [Folsomia candida]|uniref:uncharacterized protein LOC110863469 isoform X2 n=1 Tax=Folsomia candida TaxID=158441 RepID=UPI000B8F2089|nr:uncharacterized protein LOC110863469 isoform X2 [Folsomia candida]